MSTELSLLSQLARLTMLVDIELERIASERGISFADYLVLGVIRRSPGGLGRPTEICGALRRTTGGMTLTLDRLEAAGWLRRSPDQRDRRRVVVSLTAHGEQLAQTVHGALDDWEKSLPLDVADRGQASAALDLLLASVERHVAVPA